jgi:hypothetical protein
MTHKVQNTVDALDALAKGSLREEPISGEALLRSPGQPLQPYFSACTSTVNQTRARGATRMV